MLTPGERALVAELVAVGADAVRRGLVLASGGNLSAREPGASRYVITRAGACLDRLTESDFVVADVGAAAAPGASSEWKLHDRTYAARPDATCVVHLHPQRAVLLSALGRPLRLFTLDDALYVGRVAVVPYAPNGSDELADAAAAATRDADCVVLAHHGCSTVADSVEMAYRRAALLEQAASNTVTALLLGDEHTTFPTGVELRHG